MAANGGRGGNSESHLKGLLMWDAERGDIEIMCRTYGIKHSRNCGESDLWRFRKRRKVLGAQQQSEVWLPKDNSFTSPPSPLSLS